MGEHYLLKQPGNQLLKYALPVLFTVLATQIKINCFPDTGYSIPFLLYFLVTLLSGLLLGFRGVLTAPAAVVVAVFEWLIPVTAGNYTLAEMLLFLAEGLAVAFLFRLNERATQKLAESEQKYRRIIDQSAEALLLCERTGHILYASSAATRLLQRELKEPGAAQLKEFIHPEEQAQFDLVWLRLQLRGEGTTLLRQRMLCGNGGWRWTECCINNLLGDPLVAAMVVQLRDITHRVNQEKHQEDFVNLAAHELKAPITAIRGFLQIAMKRWGEDKRDDQPKYLGRIQSQTEKLLSLIDDMLNLTRIRAGELIYHFEPTDLSLCLREAAEALAASTPGRIIELEIQPDLSEVQADAARIGQVMTNLLSNALKYSPGGDPVKAELFQKDQRLEVVIRDHGIGIPADRLQRVFDRFYRVDTLPAGKFEGLGLGLYIAAEIVRKHQGRIWVESEEGKGSVFHFSLPVNSSMA